MIFYLKYYPILQNYNNAFLSSKFLIFKLQQSRGSPTGKIIYSAAHCKIIF